METSSDNIVKVPLDSNKVRELQEQSDYDYSRETLYDILQNGREAINEAIEVARSTEHPRAYEVLSKLLKDVGDVTDKLMDLNKKRRDIEEPGKQQTALPPGVNNMTNNVFVGSTSDLQRLIGSELNTLRQLEKEIGPSVAAGNLTRE